MQARIKHIDATNKCNTTKNHLLFALVGATQDNQSPVQRNHEGRSTMQAHDDEHEWEVLSALEHSINPNRMQRYYVNNRQQSNGDHEVHREDCNYLPSDRKDLGYHSSCDSAVVEAKKTYSTANGCAICSKTCHTS